MDVALARRDRAHGRDDLRVGGLLQHVAARAGRRTPPGRSAGRPASRGRAPSPPAPPGARPGSPSMPLLPGHHHVHQDDVGLVLQRLEHGPLRARRLATVSMSGSASSTRRSPLRTTAWSSTTSTRMVIGIGTSAATVVPGAGARLDAEPAADETDALAHPDEPEAVVAVASRVEAPAVVLDHRGDEPVRLRQQDAHVLRLRVLDDVRRALPGRSGRASVSTSVGRRSSPSRASRSTRMPGLSRTSPPGARSPGTSPKSSSAEGRSSTASRRTSWSVETTSSSDRRDGRPALVVRGARSSGLSPSRIDVSAWPVSSWSSRASRLRSCSCASTTRREASRLTRSERSTARPRARRGSPPAGGRRP